MSVQMEASNPICCKGLGQVMGYRGSTRLAMGVNVCPSHISFLWREETDVLMLVSGPNGLPLSPHF